MAALWPVGVVHGAAAHRQRSAAWQLCYVAFVDHGNVRRIISLRRLFEDDDTRGVAAEHADKLRRILARLNAARSAADMDLPGYRLHLLKGDLKGCYAVTVQANWRVIFRFAEGEARDVDYLDYH